MWLTTVTIAPSFRANSTYVDTYTEEEKQLPVTWLIITWRQQRPPFFLSATKEPSQSTTQAPLSVTLTAAQDKNRPLRNGAFEY